jgi:hypothetical protein
MSFQLLAVSDAVHRLGYVREWWAHTTLFAEKHKPENVSIPRSNIYGENILEFLQWVRIRPNARLSHREWQGRGYALDVDEELSLLDLNSSRRYEGSSI